MTKLTRAELELQLDGARSQLGELTQRVEALKPTLAMTRDELERELEARGWTLVHYEPGGEIPGSSSAGRAVEARPWVRAVRSVGGHAVFGESPARVYDRIDALEQELRSRGLHQGPAAVPVVRDDRPEELPSTTSDPDLIEA
jgi:hypothetical protein